MHKKTYRELQFENEHVRVWKTVISPEHPLEMHRHEADRIVVGLKGGKLKKVDHTGSASSLHFETHKAYWLSADPKHHQHEDLNLGDEPVEIMVIEMKQAQDHPLPSIPLD